MPRITRHDMLVELASDQVNQVQQLLDENSYESVHSWLHPIFLNTVKTALADMSDDDLETYYCDQLGVDMPSSSSLSSEDEEEEILSQAEEKEAANRRAMPQPSEMERRSLSSVYPVSDAKGLAEVAASLRDLALGKESLYRIESTTEIRIPMRLLFRLVHGKGSLC
jgi:hypothetical protein